MSLRPPSFHVDVDDLDMKPWDYEARQHLRTIINEKDEVTRTIKIAQLVTEVHRLRHKTELLVARNNKLMEKMLRIGSQRAQHVH